MPIPEWVKPAVQGAIVGGAIVAIVGFNAGWVVTSGTAADMAERQADEAVIASLTPVCVAQFRSQTQQAQTRHLAALQAEDSWQRGDYVEEQGWATLPGGKSPHEEVAEACSAALLKVVEKNKQM